LAAKIPVMEDAVDIKIRVFSSDLSSWNWMF